MPLLGPAVHLQSSALAWVGHEGSLDHVQCEQEKEPMGTAGPLALANEILNDGSGDPFFVLNR